MKISSPADVLFTALLTAPAPAPSSSSTSSSAVINSSAPPSYVSWFLSENRTRLAEAHTFLRGWFEARGVRVADVCAGHFVWVNLGERMGWKTEQEEKKGFQVLLDGGVYVVSRRTTRTNGGEGDTTGD